MAQKKKVTKLFKNRDIGIAFRTTNTIETHS
jgi:hypothetical protein